MAAACFLLYAMVQFRDSILMRPHPAFWRVIHAMAILYCTSLVFLLMQAKELGRGYLAVIDPALGALFICRPHVLSPPKSHNCNVLVYLHRQRTAVGEPEGICHRLSHDRRGRLSIGSALRHCENTAIGPSLDTQISQGWNGAQVNDIFLLSHTIGWFGFAMIMRDSTVCWTMSILFELLEITFQDVMTNFQECWWDHVILDTMGGNAVGIYLGMKAVRWMEIREYDWIGMQHILSMSGKFKRIAAQVQPYSWTSYRWDFFSSPHRFLCCLFIICLLDAVQLMVFFLKFALWLPPPHWLTWGRTLLWVFFAIPACREFYEFTVSAFTEDGRVNHWNRMGPNAWLAIALFGAELAVAIKYGQGEYAGQFRPMVYWAWGGSFGLLLLWCGAYFLPSELIFPAYAKMQRWMQITTDLLFLTIPMPLVVMYISECLRTFDDFGVSSYLYPDRMVHTATFDKFAQTAGLSD